ncbi:MAG: hypothetical protein IJ087_00460 [Eggerthellaceae bacterium]|nr:hypothetical protein [Eggerthellaceae bacterium]
MGNAEAAAMLRAAGMPVVYHHWPDGSRPRFPCVRYVETGRNDLVADNVNYFKRTAYEATLVSERKDDAAEAAVERALAEAGVAYSKGETVYVEAERLYQVAYGFTLPG